MNKPVFKSIRLKLFLPILLTTLLVVAGMYVFMRWSLERGFTEFIEARQQQRIEFLIDRLVESYANSGSWETLASSKRKWIQLLRSDTSPRRHAKQWMKKAMSEPQNRWPPKLPEHDNNQHFMPLNLRIMLLNVDKSTIFGRHEDLSLLTLYPINYEQKIIGYLGLLPGKPVQQIGELRFMERQAKAFIWITLLMIALSAGLALLLAYIFVRPLKKITTATKELGKGRYTMRLPVESSDELGQLAQDFNEMAAALEQSEQARRRWIADISHELRTPLAVLRGELEALQDEIRPMNRDSIDSLFSDVMRLNRLTDDLYQLALSDQGALTYRKTIVDPVNILKQCITGLMPEFKNKQLTIQLTDKTVAINLYADQDRLAQLFQNLLNNSANYTDNGGRLEIIVSKKANNLLIEMSDSEPSVPDSELIKLFDRFYRVESSRSRNLGGGGLGMAICQNIVTAHRGNISATASTLGGLTIRIELPLQT